MGQGETTAIATYRPAEVSLSDHLSGLSLKQRDYLLHKILGASDEEARVNTDVHWKTVQRWLGDDRPEFGAAHALVCLDQPIAVKQEAQYMLMSRFTNKVLLQVGQMAAMPWEKLSSPSEFKAKLKCIEIVLQSQGLDNRKPTVIHQSYETMMINVQRALEDEPDSPRLGRGGDIDIDADVRVLPDTE